MKPTIILGFLGLIFSINVDSNWASLEIFKSLRILVIYRRVPPVEDSVGVCSKEQLFNRIFRVTETFLTILVSFMAITSKLIFVDYCRFWLSSKFLFNEQELMWNREREFFLSGISNFCNSSMS